MGIIYLKDFNWFFLAGIQKDKTMAFKLMYIPNDDAQIYPFCRLQLVVKKFGQLT